MIVDKVNAMSEITNASSTNLRNKAYPTAFSTCDRAVALFTGIQEAQGVCTARAAIIFWVRGPVPTHFWTTSLYSDVQETVLN